MTAGEAVIVIGSMPATAIGLVPEFEYADVDEIGDESDPKPICAHCRGRCTRCPARRRSEHLDLGEAEYALRSAVRSAADALGALHAEAAGGDIDDPRGLVEQVLESARQHRVPDHAPTRALRVLENAAHVDAIITVSAGLIPIGLQQLRRRCRSPATRCGR